MVNVISPTYTNECDHNWLHVTTYRDLDGTVDQYRCTKCIKVIDKLRGGSLYLREYDLTTA